MAEAVVVPIFHPQRWAAEASDRPAIIMTDGSAARSYHDLEIHSNQLAHLFRTLGLGVGDHVAFMMENRPEALEIAWAALRSGLYCTAVSTRLTSGEAEYIINDCGARVLIMSTSLAPVAGALAKTTPAVQHRLCVGGEMSHHVNVDGLIATMPTSPVSAQTDGQLMLYSSGTTGRPKGVKMPLSGSPIGGANLVTPMLEALGFTANSVYLSPAPLYHAAPLNWSMSAQRLGGTVLVMPRFDPEETLSLIERYHVTHVQFVPTMLSRMLCLPEQVRERYDHSSLKGVIHAAAPCPAHVKSGMIDWWGPIIDEYYSGTEGAGITYCTSAEWMEHPGTVGRAILGRVHIVDSDSGDELSAGAVGTVRFSGGQRFSYHRDPEKTKLAYDAEGRSTLGDVGYVDEDGYLYLTGRLADTIIAGGVNIYPIEIENVLLLHPSVEDAAVFGVPNDDLGEEVRAVVQPPSGVTADDDLVSQLGEHCRQHLARYKCPRTIVITDALPRGENGKLYKHELS